MDPTKVFDTVTWEDLWKIMQFIQIVQQFHDGMQAHVLGGGELFTAFLVINGVKQGCVFAPTLFSMMVTEMLTDVFHESGPGIVNTYKRNGKFFNL